MAAVREGLSRAQLVPIGTAWAEIQAGWRESAGLYLMGETGWHPLPPLALYAFGQLSQRETMAGAGLKVTW